MNDQELLVLVAKDYAIRTHGSVILTWSRQTWHAAVEGILRTFTDDTIKQARVAYPDA